MFLFNFLLYIYITYKKFFSIIFFFFLFFLGYCIFINWKNIYFFFFIKNNFFSFFFDTFSMYFFFLLLYVRRIIIIYSFWYITNEPHQKSFIFYIFFFIFFIFILTNSGNLLLLLVRWERVRVISFFLIRWWFGRSEATICSSQAIYYNRFGDFFFILSILFISLRPFFILNSNTINNFIFFFISIAIISKSSQIFMHPWLPNAIERPTPVSSLLHSSTIVVARVYLLIRLQRISPLLFVCLPPILRRITILFIRICSSFQTDIKKIIAYSTSSQLRFIIFTVFYISSYIRFFLIFTHAFFKSLLFLVSRLLIHSDNDDQENTRINSRSTSSLSIYAFIISAMSLIRIPFFSRFFSKDLILENIWSGVTNILIILIFILRCIFTAIYSISLILVKLSFNKNKLISIEKINKIFFWIPIILVGRVFYRNFFFFFFDIWNELILNIKIFYIPVFILIIRFFFFFFIKKNIDARVYKFTFFYNPLIHSFFSKTWLLFSYNFLLLDYFFFEYLIFFKKINIFFINKLQVVKRFKIIIFLRLLIIILIIFLIYVKIN